MLPTHTLKRSAALGALVAISVTVPMPALAGARPIDLPNAGAHTRHGSTHAARSRHYAPILGCRAVLDPMNGEMHGGCPPGGLHSTYPAAPAR
jgi:hypothetical protein